MLALRTHVTEEGKCLHAQRKAQREEQSPLEGEETKTVGTEGGK